MGFMKKITIISLIFLSVQLFSQTQSLAYRNPNSTKLQIQTDSLSGEKITIPRPTVWKLLHQGFMGFAIGSTTNIVTWALIGSGSNSISETIYLGLFCFTLGEAFGIYWIGNTSEIHGSFGYTFLGSAIGTGMGLAIYEADKSFIFPIILLPGVGGIIAFYFSAEEVVPQKTDALIEFQNEKVQFGTPRLFLTKIDKTSTKLRYNFELLRVNF